MLWFDLVTSQERIYPMGSELESSTNPTFKVKALGAFNQKSGCAGNEIIYPEISNRIENLCKGECYNPTDKRKLISRIEVVRIRPQIYPGELSGTPNQLKYKLKKKNTGNARKEPKSTRRYFRIFLTHTLMNLYLNDLLLIEQNNL